MMIMLLSVFSPLLSRAGATTTIPIGLGGVSLSPVEFHRFRVSHRAAAFSPLPSFLLYPSPFLLVSPLFLLPIIVLLHSLASHLPPISHHPNMNIHPLSEEHIEESKMMKAAAAAVVRDHEAPTDHFEWNIVKYAVKAKDPTAAATTTSTSTGKKEKVILTNIGEWLESW